MKFRVPRISLHQEPTNREKLLFGAALIGILVLFFSYFWTPQSQKLEAMRSDRKGIEMQEDAIRKLIEASHQQLAQQRDQPRRESGTSEHVKRILERRVTDLTDEVNSTIDILSGFRIARRVTIQRVDPGEYVEKDNYTIVPISVRLTGRYTGIQRYMESLEKLERPLVIKGFEMDTDPGQPGQLDAEIQIELYIAKR